MKTTKLWAWLPSGFDKLYMLTSVNFLKRTKMKIGKDHLKKEVGAGTPYPLTRRALLSQVAGLYDPIGLVTPIGMPQGKKTLGHHVLR